EGTGASADFIQNQQTFIGGVSENISHLCHFHHESTLSAGQIIGGSHTGENPIHNSDVGFFRRNEASDLGHKHNQRRLAHIGGFSCHIGACNNGDSLLLIVQIGVIGNKHI